MMPKQSDPELGRLRWRCRRGMRELDRLLSDYLARGYPHASGADQQTFRELLELQDPELFSYFVGRTRPDSAALAALVDRITQSVAQP